MHRNDVKDRKIILISATMLVATSLAHAAPPVDYTMMPFSDEFNGAAIDITKWNAGVIDYQSGSTWLRRNHAGNNTISGGNLIQTTLYQDVTGDGTPDWTCSSMSAKLFRQRFGYWECRMQITKYSYTDANFWSSDPSGLHLNQMDGFEIDAPEAWGTSRNNTQTGTGRYTSNIYDHNSSLDNPFEQSFSTPDISNSFNTYAWEWATDNTVKCYFNGTLLFTHSAEYFNSIESLLSQSPVLGTALWATTYNTGPTGNSIADGDQKLVDYVRVYQKPGWIGTGTTKIWNNAANWGADGIPGSGKAAIFNTSAASGVIQLLADQAVQEIAFQTSSTDTTTINGPGKLLLGATSAVNASNTAVGGINLNNDTKKTVTINAEIIAQHKLQFSNFAFTVNYGATAGVDLILNNTITAATPNTPINFLTTGPIKINGAIGNTIGDITKGAQGNLYLNSSNSFTGILDVRDGVVFVNADGALGSITNGVQMNVTGQFDQPSLVFGSVNYTLAEPVSIIGDGSQNSGYTFQQGAIDIAGTGATATFPGPITLAGNSTIGFGTASQAATLNLSGPVNVGSNILTLNGGGVLNLSGQIIGNNINGQGQVIKNGSGTVNLSASNTSFKGTWLFNAGTVVINSINALGGGTGEVLNFNGGTLKLSASIGTSKAGRFDLGNGTFDTNQFTATIGGPFSGAGGLIKSGLGTLNLNGDNTFTGSTVVNAGKLQLAYGLKNSKPLTIASGAIAEVSTNGQVKGLSLLKTLGIPSSSGIFIGKLELHDNDLILDYTGSTSSYASTLAMVKSGLVLLGGNGFGITSTQVDTQSLPGTILAVVDDGNPAVSGGVTVLSGFVIPNPESSVLVKFTWFGDSNLDGIVDGSDYALIDTGFTSGGSLVGWVFGDYDYSGAVDGSDYALIDTGFISQSGTLPEPTIAGLAMLAVQMLIGRRRKS